MNLNELATTNFLKVLVYGDSGTGKSIFAASFPGPIKYWDFDHKVSSVAQFYKKDEEKLKSIQVTQFANLPNGDRIKAWEKEVREIQDLVKAKKPLPFQTLILDSLTTFTSSMLQHYFVAQPGIKRAHPDLNAMQDYQLLDKHLSQAIPGLLSLDCNIVMVGHMGVDKDETTGQILRQTLMPGKFAAKLPIWFEEVYVASVKDGKYLLQTQSDSSFKCRTQRGLPKEISSSYAEIIKNTK